MFGFVGVVYFGIACVVRWSACTLSGHVLCDPQGKVVVSLMLRLHGFVSEAWIAFFEVELGAALCCSLSLLTPCARGATVCFRCLQFALDVLPINL